MRRNDTGNHPSTVEPQSRPEEQTLSTNRWTLCGFALGFGLFTPPAATAAIPLPDGSSVEQVDFERHIMGLLGRMGCNSGSCHGSFQGKGGLRLSLFGYDPARDYNAITREANGRRLSVSDPDRSLLLLKATGQEKHEGLTRFTTSSWQYRVFRQWIAQGAAWTKGSGDIRSIRITPPEYAFKKPGQTGQLSVLATFADGSEE